MRAQTKNVKGLSYSLEALMAISIVTVALILAFSGVAPPQRTGLEAAKDDAFSCLRGLDAEGRLREDTMRMATTNLTDSLKGCIRGPFNHTVQICKQSGCTSISLDRTTDVVAARYYSAGFNATDPAAVIVYIWAVL